MGVVMRNRELYLKNIADSLGLLSRQVSIHNAINFYDINIVAESFYSGLLNLVLDSHLVNVNIVEKNAPGIDLVDEEKRLSIQVTSDNTSDKIKHTIEEVLKEGAYNKYDRLIVLILTKKRKYTTEFDTKGKFHFDKAKDIWDVEDLIVQINSLSTDKLKELNDYLRVELDDKCASMYNTEANEIETIIDLIEFISSNKRVSKLRDVEIDPDYKINHRFKEFAQSLITQYTTLLTVYGSALEEIENLRGSDEARDLVTMIYLQDISISYLDVSDNDPIKALNSLTDFFSGKLSENGKNYDRMAIKFYLISEMIKCSVFPNERGEYNDGEF